MFRFKNNLVARFWILVCLGALLATGCGPLPEIQTPTPSPQPICSPTENFYTSNEGAIGLQSQKALEMADNIYARYQNNPNDLELARSEAIDFLAFETMRWSHSENIPVDDNNSVRIMMTFITPELIRAVLLNYVLDHASQSPLSGLSLPDYSKNVLTLMDAQKKYLFLITIQPITSNKSTQSFKIPMDHIALINNNGLHVKAINKDDFLNQTFNLSSEMHAGFLFYPFGNMNDGDCQRVLDPLRDTSITLDLEAQIGNETKKVTGEILFSPPLQVAYAIPQPNPNLILSEADKQPRENLPRDLAVPIGSQSRELAYWRVWGQFVWAKMTYDYFVIR